MQSQTLYEITPEMQLKLSHIKQLIACRVRSLGQHRDYLIDIKAGRIEPTDANDYFLELFGFIPDQGSTLDDAITLFKQKHCTTGLLAYDVDSPNLLTLLKIQAQFELRSCEVLHEFHEQNYISLKKMSRNGSFFNPKEILRPQLVNVVLDLEFVKTLCKEIQDISKGLEPIHAYIIFNNTLWGESTTQMKKFTSFNWSNLLAGMKKTQRQIEQIAEKNSTIKEFLSRFKAEIELFDDAMAIIEQQIINNKNEEEDIGSYLQRNVAQLYTIFPFFERMTIILGYIKEMQKHFSKGSKPIHNHPKPKAPLAKQSDEKENLYKSEMEKVQQENIAFKQQREDSLRVRKEEINKYREEKKAKQEPLIKANASTKQVTNINVNYENLAMQRRLYGLSDKHLDLIENLLNAASNISYQEAKNLIVNHLGGRILEIGNGSSHERIELEKYIIEVSNVRATDEPVLQGVVVTGGICKQHGKQHTERTLNRFNLKSFQNLLISSGITLSVVSKIRASKESKCAPRQQ